MVYQQNRKLENAKKTGFEAIDIGNDTNMRLKQQTETLQRGRDRVRNLGEIIWIMPLDVSSWFENTWSESIYKKS